MIKKYAILLLLTMKLAASEDSDQERDCRSVVYCQKCQFVVTVPDEYIHRMVEAHYNCSHYGWSCAEIKVAYTDLAIISHLVHRREKSTVKNI